MKGRFIVVYGMNNLGKTTATTSLVEQLNKQGTKTEYLKYPVYEIESGKRLNAYLRNGNPESLTVEQAQKLFAQNRRDYEGELTQLLNSGITVIAEDYVGTGIAWGLIFGVSLEKLQEFNKGLLEPDVAVLLDGERFSTGHEGNHKHEGVSAEDWRKGREIHQRLAGRFGWKTVRANQEREAVLSDLVDLVASVTVEGNRGSIEVC